MDTPIRANALIGEKLLTLKRNFLPSRIEFRSVGEVWVVMTGNTHVVPEVDVTRHVIPLREIRGGGPPKDGISALDEPDFVSAGEADRDLKASDSV